MYQRVAGIRPEKDAPRFRHVVFALQAYKRLSWCKTSIGSRYGHVSGRWKREGGQVIYEVDIPKRCTYRLCVNNFEIYYMRRMRI